MHLRSLARSATLALTLGATAFAQQTATGHEPFRDASLPIDSRITDLLSRFTLQEKAAQLNHTNHGVPRLGLPAWGGWNQTLHGVWSKQPTTLFPIPTAMGATWDPELIHTVADAMSDEGRALYNAHAEGPRTPHGLVFRSPVINISRDPRWGRIQEVFSEDPLLTGRMAVAYVRGLQGDDVNTPEARRHRQAFCRVQRGDRPPAPQRRCRRAQPLRVLAAALAHGHHRGPRTIGDVQLQRNQRYAGRGQPLSTDGRAP